MPYIKVYLQVALKVTLGYYTDMDVSVDDIVVAETRYGLVKARVTSLGPAAVGNPFDSNMYRATKHVVENVTKKIYDKENTVMAGTKTIEVKHLNTDRKYILSTDKDLNAGDIVVFECQAQAETVRNINMMSVGVVIDADPPVLTSGSWVVDVVDLTDYVERKERLKKADKLKAKLNEKKKQFQDIELLRLIAHNDPETKAMLDEYTELIGG